MATFGSFTTGQVLTAAELNAAGTFTTFTPVFSFGGVAANTSSSYGYYTLFNKLLVLHAGFVSSGAQTAGGLSFTMPTGVEVSEGMVYQRVGQWYAYDASPAIQYIGAAYVVGTDGKVIAGFAQSGSGLSISNTAPFTTANQDEFNLIMVVRNV